MEANEILIKKYLLDIENSILSVQEFTQNLTWNDYQANKLVRRAVEREIAIIGEAVNKLSKIVPNLPFSSAKQIIATRNYVVHSYDNVDDVIIWGIVQNHLATLLEEVRSFFQ
ncbi:HepT-like ribonuclease domain-containing protein [Raineya sp.]|jgi:uncharacterized protein with HEPN domain